MPEAPPTVVAPPEPCARCGGDSDFEIASLWLCIACYHIAGSTCAGIGRVPAAVPAAPTPVAPRAGPDDQVC